MTYDAFPPDGAGDALNYRVQTGQVLPAVFVSVVGALVTVISFYLPFVTVQVDGFSQSAAISADTSSGIFGLYGLSWVSIVVAVGACVAVFFVTKNKKHLNTIGSGILGAAFLVFSNWLTNFDPAERARSSIGDLDLYGIDVSRDVGWYLFPLGAIILFAGGGLFIYLAYKTPEDDRFAPGQPYGQVGQVQQPGQTYQQMAQGRQHAYQQPGRAYGYPQQRSYPQQTPYTQQGLPTQSGQYASLQDQAGSRMITTSKVRTVGPSSRLRASNRKPAISRLRASSRRRSSSRRRASSSVRRSKASRRSLTNHRSKATSPARSSRSGLEAR